MNKTHAAPEVHIDTARTPRGLMGLFGLAMALALTGCSTLPGWMVLQGRAEITDHRHFVNAPIARAATPSPMPAAPAALVWPGGLDAEANSAMLAERQTVALLVLRRGVLVHEAYFGGYARDSVFTTFSVAKSVVSMLMGVAVAQGRIGSVDDPVTRYLPELLNNDPRFAQITLRHLLMMRSGIEFQEAYTVPWSQAAAFYLGPDLKAQLAKLQIRRPPDQAYAYSSGDTQVLAMVLQRAVNKPLAQYLQDSLWQPMGAEFDASWSLDSAASGQARAFCCLNARAVDYLRLGQLVLNEGRSTSGAQLVPRDWLAQSTAPQQRPGTTDAERRNVESPGRPSQAFYAWQWRRAPVLPPAGPLGAQQPGVAPASAAGDSAATGPGRDVYAQGLRGQYIYIAPDQQTVVVRLGRDGGGLFWPRWLGELARLNP